MDRVYVEKDHCFGCEACGTVCPVSAISMHEDEEGFRYPYVDQKKCIDCKKCINICPAVSKQDKYEYNPFVYGGYCVDESVRGESTSGGFFSVISDVFFEENNCCIFGAEAEGMRVYHSYTDRLSNINKYRKSKYAQSEIGNAYKLAKEFLQQGKKVLFSGTPCQISALKSYLGELYNSDNLLTIDLVCEGIPSPLLLRKYSEYLFERYGSKIISLDYRYKQRNKWDFEVMRIELENGRVITRDRWFNPFWILWARRLMSRPSCVICPFRTPDRIADITLGDLWGVQNYCPELYGNNCGAGLVFCNSDKGKREFSKVHAHVFGHELPVDEVLKYQRPMRVIVPANDKRTQFMKDLTKFDYKTICRKWNAHEPFSVLFRKYVWGSNRQVVLFWDIKQRFLKCLKIPTK